MQSASQKSDEIYWRIMEPEERVYSNIDPRTGCVVAYEHVSLSNILNDYNNSGLNLSSIESLARRPEKPNRNACGKRCCKLFEHLFDMDISLKYMEITLLAVGTCLYVYSIGINELMDTTSTVMIPLVTFVLFLLLAIFTMCCMAFRLHVSNTFLIIVNTVAVLMTSVTGGVLLGVWLNVPKKIKLVLYWESLAILSHTIVSFVAAITYLIDLTWSLHSLNKHSLNDSKE